MDFPRAISVFLGFLAVYLTLQVYFFYRISAYLRVTVRNRINRRALLALVALVFLFMLYPLAWRAFFGFRFYEPYPWPLRGFVAFWIVGSMGSALILLGYDLVRGIAAFLSRGRSVDVTRRDFLKKSVGVAAAAPFLMSGYGVVFERRRFEVDHFELPVSGLSSSLAGLTVVQLTDLHVGPFMRQEEIEACAEAVNRLKPDLIMLTGDFVSTSADEALPCARGLSGLRARHGVFACLGNHDVYAAVSDELARLFSERGIEVLRNDAVSIGVGGSVLNVLGIEDLRAGRPDLNRALRAAEREPGEVRLLLSHRPEVFPQAARKGIEIVLSGHYHGGQIKLGADPESFSVARLLTPFTEGFFRLPRRPGASDKDAVLFVSRGIGTTGLPIRINCPPQIAHFTLTKA